MGENVLLYAYVNWEFKAVVARKGETFSECGDELLRRALGAEVVM